MQCIDKDNLNAHIGRYWVPKTLYPLAEALKKRYEGKQPLIAVFTAGAIPYYTGFPTLDVYGLNDANLTRMRHEIKGFGSGLVGHDLFDAAYIESRKPDVLLFDIPGIKPQCDLHPGACERLFTHYTPEIIDIPGYGVTVWQRKNR